MLCKYYDFLYGLWLHYTRPSFSQSTGLGVLFNKYWLRCSAHLQGACILVGKVHKYKVIQLCEEVVKFAPRKLKKAFWRRIRLSRMLQNEEELARIIETFDVLSKVRSSLGSFLRWELGLRTRSPLEHPVTLFLLVLFFSDSSQPGFYQTGYPLLKAHDYPLTNQEGKLQVLWTELVPYLYPQPDSTASHSPFFLIKCSL